MTNQESITHEVIMKIFSKLEFHNGDCLCHECETKLFSDLKELQKEYYSKIDKLKKCKGNFHDPHIRKQYTSVERCSECGEL